VTPTAPNASPDQIRAGNYRKHHRRFQGLRVSIENRKGSIRRGVDPEGNPWETRMQNDYGYIKGSLGMDGDHVDCFLGPDPESETAYVISQRQPPAFQKTEEQKVMLGFSGEAEAVAAFHAHYDDQRFLGEVRAMPMKEFKAKVLRTGEGRAMVKSRETGDFGEPADLSLAKASVRPHVRKTKKGKMILVSAYSTRTTKKMEEDHPDQLPLRPYYREDPVFGPVRGPQIARKVARDRSGVPYEATRDPVIRRLRALDLGDYRWKPGGSMFAPPLRLEGDALLWLTVNTGRRLDIPEPFVDAIRESLSTMVSVLKMAGKDFVFEVTNGGQSQTVRGNAVGRANGDRIWVHEKMLRQWIAAGIGSRYGARQFLELLGHEITHTWQFQRKMLTQQLAHTSRSSQWQYFWMNKSRNRDGVLFDSLPWKKKPWEIQANWMQGRLADVAIERLVSKKLLPPEALTPTGRTSWLAGSVRDQGTAGVRTTTEFPSIAEQIELTIRHPEEGGEPIGKALRLLGDFGDRSPLLLFVKGMPLVGRPGLSLLPAKGGTRRWQKIGEDDRTGDLFSGSATEERPAAEPEPEKPDAEEAERERKMEERSRAFRESREKHRVEVLDPALSAYFEAYRGMTSERLERNRMKPDGIDPVDWLMQMRDRKPTWDRGRKIGKTGIQYLSTKDLWPTDDGKGERLRRAMLAALRAVNSAPGYNEENFRDLWKKGDQKPESGFAPGDTAYLFVEATQQWEPVNYRGRHGSDQAVVVRNGQQWTVPADSLRKDRPEEKANPRKGTVGMMVAAGEQVLTATGRKTSPFPKVDTGNDRKSSNTLRRVDRWLLQNALDEAQSRSDEFNARQFQQALESRKPTQSDKDGAEEYLFGEDRPEPQKPVLKPLAGETEKPAEPYLERARALMQEHRTQLDPLNKVAVDKFVRKVRALARNVPVTDEKTTMILDTLSTRLDKDLKFRQAPQKAKAMPYVPKSEAEWREAIDAAEREASEGAADGSGLEAFRRMHDLLERRNHWRESKLLGSNNGEVFGITARSSHGDRWATLLPEMSQQGYEARLQYFDKHGFSGHMVFRTKGEALKDMVGAGYVVPDRTAMDRMAVTDEWAEGMLAAERVRAENEGRAERKWA
jgi:hypothetical protein